MRLWTLSFVLTVGFTMIAPNQGSAAPSSTCSLLFSADVARTEIALRQRELTDFYRGSVWEVPDVANYNSANPPEISSREVAANSVEIDVSRGHFEQWPKFATVLSGRSATTIGFLAILRSATNRQIVVEGHSKKLATTSPIEGYLTQKDYETLWSLGEPMTEAEKNAKAAPATKPYRPKPSSSLAGILIGAHTDAMFAKIAAAQTQVATAFTRERLATDGDFRIDFGNGKSARFPTLSPFAGFFPSVRDLMPRESRSVPLTELQEPSRRLLYLPDARLGAWFRYASNFDLAQALQTLKIPVEAEARGAIMDRETLLRFTQHLTGQNGRRDPKTLLVQFKASVFEVLKGDSYGRYKRQVIDPNPRSADEAYGLVLGLQPNSRNPQGPATLRVLVTPSQWGEGYVVEIPADATFFESVTRTYYLGVKPHVL